VSRKARKGLTHSWAQKYAFDGIGHKMASIKGGKGGGTRKKAKAG